MTLLVFRQSIVAAFAIAALSITARAQGYFKGVVTGDPGVTFDSLRVEIGHPGTPDGYYVTPDAHGNFTGRHASPGKFNLCVYRVKPGGGVFCTDAQLGAGETDITITVPSHALDHPPVIPPVIAIEQPPSSTQPCPSTCVYAGVTYSDYAITCQANLKQMCVAGVWQLLKNATGGTIPC